MREQTREHERADRGGAGAQGDLAGHARMPVTAGGRDRALAAAGGLLLGVVALVLLAVSAAVTRESSRLAAAHLDAAGEVVNRFTEERTATLGLLARIAGQEPRLGAAMTADAATLADVLTHDLNPSLEADFMCVTDQQGRVRADTRGRLKPGTDRAGEGAVRAALAGQEWRGTVIVPGEIELAATAPIRVGGQALGTVTIGRQVNDEMAVLLSRYTGSQVTLFAGGQIAASAWPVVARPALECALHEALPDSLPPGDPPLRFIMPFAGHPRLCLLTSLPGPGRARGQLLVQSSLDPARQPLTSLRRTLLLIDFMGLLLAALGGILVARVAGRER